MEQYEAIFYRRSVRHFSKDPLPERLLDNLKKYMMQVMPLYRSEPFRILLVDRKEQPGAVSGPGRVEAPYYLAFFGQDTMLGRCSAGYLAEQLTLYLASREVGTCYQGLARLKEQPPETQPELKLLFLVAFGISEETFREPEEASRLSLEKLAACKDKLSEESRTILRAARMAPSSMNSQPWRFVVYRNRIHLFARKERLGLKTLERMRDVNMGIVLYHMMLAAEELWLTADLQVSELISERSWKNNEYILTLYWRNL